MAGIYVTAALRERILSNLMVHVFVVSMLRSTERRQHVINLLGSLGIKFSFFDAVDGFELSEDDRLKLAGNDDIKSYCGHELSPGEIGCALSHIKLYEHIIKRRLERSVILEDDFIADHGLPHLLNSIEEKAPERAELIFLYHGKAKSYPLKRRLVNGYKLARYRYPSKNSHRKIISTVGYMLSLSGAKKLLAQAYPVRMPSDYLTGTIQLSRINSYGVEPCCIDHDDNVFETTIEDRNYGRHIENL